MSINVVPPSRITACLPRGCAGDLFPHLDVVIAYRLLFGIYSGIVPDGIDDLEIGRHRLGRRLDDPAVLRQRRTAAESLNLPRRAVRLLEQWLAHSALLRSFVPPDEQTTLWLGMSQPGDSRRLERGRAGPRSAGGRVATAWSATTVSR